MLLTSLFFTTSWGYYTALPNHGELGYCMFACGLFYILIGTTQPNVAFPVPVSFSLDSGRLPPSELPLVAKTNIIDQGELKTSETN
jgi:hypothetical protein